MWPFKKRTAPADPYGPHIVGPWGKRWRIQRELRADGKEWFCVQTWYSVSEWSTLPSGKYETLEEAMRWLNWWIEGDKALYATQSETVYPARPTPPETP